MSFEQKILISSLNLAPTNFPVISKNPILVRMLAIDFHSVLHAPLTIASSTRSASRMIVRFLDRATTTSMRLQ